jgi:hypothetical protein
MLTIQDTQKDNPFVAARQTNPRIQTLARSP